MAAVQLVEPRSPAIDKALSILELLSLHPGGLRMADVARELALPKSSTHLTLEVLRARGYVVRDDNGCHRLGLRLFEIGARVLQALDVRQVARPYLETLSDRTGLTSHLAALDGHQVVYLDRVDGHGLVRFDTYVGKRASVNLTAVGKAIVAYLPERQLDEILRADFRRGTVRAPGRPFDFKAQLREFRELGYMIEDEEEVPGIYCAAAPLRDASANVVGSVGVIGLKTGLPGGDFRLIGAEVRDTAAAISAQLGFVHGT
ncbi:MAG: IclR family transcriptional regulator [Chloroflexi bacterium]|nr:IclR family transcriptional regulator [Chloroflexota bacterium]MBV9597764.1 IclR family transcriptional regulator [Chloroflexota bacterium]